MWSSLQKFPGLSISCLFGLVRLVGEVCLVALLLGRSGPAPALPVALAPRLPAHPRYVGSLEEMFVDRSETPRLFDTETGAFAPWTAPDLEGVDHLTCSPWRDGDGQYHLVGRNRQLPVVSRAGSQLSIGFSFCTFPAGQVLQQVGLEVAPVGKPCWSPDQSDRVLFAGGDGQLYLFDFAGNGGIRVTNQVPPRPLLWMTKTPEYGTILFSDPCWSSLPGLGGRLLVALSYRENPPRPRFRKLWWLQLSPDSGSIVGAERVLIPDALGPSRDLVEEMRPGVGMSPDGTPLLAFLAQEQGATHYDLWVMPIKPAASGQGPQVRLSTGRKLVEGCSIAFAPTFSADGRWVCVARPVGTRYRLERHAVPALADAPAGVVDSLPIEAGISRPSEN